MPRAMPVSVRGPLARLHRPAEQGLERRADGALGAGRACHASRTWPSTSCSPTTTESRPAATVNRCRTASARRGGRTTRRPRSPAAGPNAGRAAPGRRRSRRGSARRRRRPRCGWQVDSSTDSLRCSAAARSCRGFGEIVGRDGHPLEQGRAAWSGDCNRQPRATSVRMLSPPAAERIGSVGRVGGGVSGPGRRAAAPRPRR